MKFTALFTEYDDAISGDTNIDGLGMRIIWSAHGRQIYNSYINSISNDVRNYTLNLLNHWVIRSLTEDERFVLSTTQDYLGGNKNSRSFKQACIIFLENIFTWTMVEAEESGKDVDVSGVLGSANARRRLRDDDNPKIYLAADRNAEILVRQYSLGVNGRYKGPLKNLGFFNDAFRYTNASQGSPWHRVETELIRNWPEFGELGVRLRDTIEKALSSANGVPMAPLDEIDREIKNLFISHFTKPGTVGNHTRDFWLGLTKLDRGVAGKIGEELKPYVRSADDPELPLIYRKVLAAADNDAERQIIADIVNLEPFLEHVDLLFRLICSTAAVKIRDIPELWERYGRRDSSLADFSKPVTPNSKVLSEEGYARLHRLVKIANLPDLLAQARSLVEYHADLMEKRGQQAWVKIAGDGSIQRNINALVLPDPVKRRPEGWFHQYYARQHLNFLKGLSHDFEE